MVEKNHIFYYCSNCKDKHSNVIDNDGVNYSTKENGLIKHTAIQALIENDGKVLLVKRKNYPFGFGLPSTHLHYGESVEDALTRMFIDKIGLDLRSKRLVFRQTLIDPCRYGAELHDCYLFKCVTEDFLFTGTDQNLYWENKKDLKNIDLVPNAKLIFSRLRLIENKNPQVLEEAVNRTASVKEGSIIDSLPLSIMIYPDKGKPSFINNAALKFLDSVQKEDKKEYHRLTQLLARIAKKTIQAKSSHAENIVIDDTTYNVTANPLINDNKKCGATVMIGAISEEKQFEINDVLAHRTSITLCSNSNFSTIIRTIMKQMFFSMNITGASLMILEDDTLRVNFRYSSTSKAKRNPLNLKVGEGVGGWVAANKTLLAIPDTEAEPLFVGHSLPSERSLLSVPVISNGQILGVLNLTKSKGKYFSEKETRAAAIIANRIALAIENEELYQELAADKKKTASIIDNSADGISAVNADGEVIIWNKRISEITGFKSPQEYFKANPDRTLSIENVIKRAKTLRKDSFYDEYERINANGENIPVGITFSLVRNKDNQIDFMIVQMKDLSREKSIEVQQKEFIYTTTHELRTPITAIRGYLSMIMNGDAGKVLPKQKKYFSRVYEATEKLVMLVEDLLQVARVEEGDITFESAPYDLKSLVRDVAKDFKIKSASKKLQLTASYPKASIAAKGDRERTKQALSNLIDNAIKYTRKGSIKVSIETEDNKFAIIKIIDTGIGIPQKEIPNIFSRFYRVPNSESVKAGGTGLGLYIVKKLIERQKGKVEVASREGEGTTFVLKLPLSK